ncbi:MAG: hypothetical protein ACLFVL_06730 [Candidatus Aenigmatarchaeota archaeon]
MKKKRSGLLLLMVILLLSTSMLSGCTTDEQEDVVGIPKDESASGDFYSEEDRAEIFVPILNTYDEAKEIVVRFKVTTKNNNQYSELKKIRVPANSKEVYSQEIEVPEREEGQFFDAEIVVPEDEVKIIEVGGRHLDNRSEAVVNATIANTNFERKDVSVNFKAIMETGEVESEKISITLRKNSMEIHSHTVSVDGTPEDYNAEIMD